jgi:hypothetical protein
MSKNAVLQDFIENFILARKLVISFNIAYHEFFDKVITIEGLKSFCESIDINLKKSPYGENVIGRLESRLENNLQIVNIFYNTTLDIVSKHNAILHEIGHWVLLNSSIDLSNKPIFWKETFANNFANLICIPFSKRYELVDKLFKIQDVKEVSRIINSYKTRLSVSNLLKTLNLEIRNDKEYFPLLSNNKIFLSVKLIPKKRSNIDPKFRIISALYNHKMYYIPEQSRINQVVQDIDDKFNIDVGEVSMFESVIKLYNLENDGSLLMEKPSSKYKSKKYECKCEIFRLKRSLVDNLSTYLILIDINTN